MAYMRLGDLLIAAGAISEEQLQTALQTQKQQGATHDAGSKAVSDAVQTHTRIVHARN